MPDGPCKVLLANADVDELEKLAEMVEGAGHDVVALAITTGAAGDAVVEHRPDVAMILVEGDEAHALDLVVEIRSFAEIPLVVLARSIGDEMLRSAADQALEVMHLPGEPETLARVIELARTRHAEYDQMARKVGELDGILERRSAIEQAKGILMERHGIDASEAFARIREHARANQVKVVDVAASVVTARNLLSAEPVAAE